MISAQAIRLPNSLINPAKKYGKIFKRSVPKQIEHWAIIGQIAEENPDLSYTFIKDTLIALEEVKNGEITEYSFG